MSRQNILKRKQAVILSNAVLFGVDNVGSHIYYSNQQPLTNFIHQTLVFEMSLYYNPKEAQTSYILSPIAYTSNAYANGLNLAYRTDISTLQFYVGNANCNVYYDINVVMPLDNWVHIHLIGDGSTVKFLIDGVEYIPSVIGTFVGDGITQSNFGLVLGGYGQLFKEIGICGFEIKELGVTKLLLPLCEGNGITVYDTSGNDNHTTLNNVNLSNCWTTQSVFDYMTNVGGNTYLSGINSGSNGYAPFLANSFMTTLIGELPKTFTVAMRCYFNGFYPSIYSINEMITMFQQFPSTPFQVQYRGTFFVYGVGSTAGSSLTTTIPDNSELFICLTYDSVTTNCTLYINELSQSKIMNPPVAIRNFRNIYFGAREDLTTSSSSNINIKNIWLYDTELTSVQVAELKTTNTVAALTPNHQYNIKDSYITDLGSDSINLTVDANRHNVDIGRVFSTGFDATGEAII